MTNIVLNVAVLVVLVGVCVPVLRRMRAGALLWTLLLLCLLTMVFDTAMIAADLYVFDESKILGIYLWGAPLEDFAYAVAAGLAMPVLWTVLERRSTVRAVPGTPGTPGTDRAAAAAGDT